MYRFVIMAAAWLASLGIVRAQSLSIEGGNVFESGQICLDVTVDGFQNLIGMEFELRWDSTVLEFESVTAQSSLPGFSDVQISDPTETSQSTPSNIVIVSWFDNDLTPRSLPDGDVIFEICYNAIGMVGSSSTMNLYNLNFTDPDLNAVSFDDVDNIVSVTASGGENLTFDFPTTNADSGQIICVPLTVVNFDTISQFSFGVKWDATVLSYQNVLASLALSGFSSGNVLVVGADSVTVNWTDNDGTGESLPNGTELFELCFRVVGAPARSSLLQIGNLSASQPTGSITDLQGNNGLIIVNAPPEAEDLRIMASDLEVNPGNNFCVPVRVSGFKDLEGLDFTVSWNSSIINYSRVQNLASLDGLDMSDITTMGGSPSGLDFSWVSSDGEGKELGFNAILFEVCFSATGAAGTSSNFDFSNMDATNADALPVTEIENNATISIVNPTAPDLVLRLDTVSIMNGQTGCLTMRVEEFNAVDMLQFEINWNPQNINFQSADILANVPGLDDTDMTTPNNGGSDGQLILDWEDANGVGRSLSDGTALMEICFQADGSNVSRTLVVENIDVESSTGLQVDGVGRNGRITIPSTGGGGDLTLTAGDLNLDLNDAGCFPVRIDGFEDMLTMEFRIAWDNSVFEYTGVQNLASLAYFSVGSISNPFDGQLNIVWIDDDVTGKTLANNTILFEICGTGSSVGQTTSSITNEEASDLNSTVNITKNNGTINVTDGGSGSGDLILTAEDLNLNLNASGCFPVRVDGFTDMLTMEFRLSWDNSVFEYTGVQNLASLDYFSGGSISNPFDGQLNIVWIDDDVTGKSLPNNTILFEVCGTGKQMGTANTVFSNAEASNTSQVITVGNNNGTVVVDGGGSGTDDLEIIVGDETVAPGGNVCVPISVRQFTDMLGMTFSLRWDDAIIDFDRIVLANNLIYLTQGGISTPPDIPQDNMIFVNWIDDELIGQDLADNTELFSICFDAVGSAGDISDIIIGDTEFIDESQTEIPGVLTNGSVEIRANNAPGFELNTTSGNTVDQGDEICIPFRVSGFTQLTELEALITWDENIFRFQSIQNIANVEGLNISDFLTPNSGGSAGNVALNWTDPDNDGESLNNNDVLFELCLEAIGDEGESSDINISDLMVENVSSSNVSTSATNGDIRINTTSTPTDVKIIAEKTNGARNSQVCAAISVEGFNNIGGFTFRVEWDEDILDFASVNALASLTGFDDMDILDPIEQPTLGSSVLVDWDHPSNGSASLPTPSELFEICFDLIGDFGATSSLNISSILVSDEMGGNIVTSKEDGFVSIDPEEDNGQVTIIAPIASGGQGEELCVDITVRNFNNILSSEFSIVWDPNILELDRVINLASLPDFNQARISTPSENMIPGLLGVSWFDENFGTHNLSDDAIFFTTCFDLIGPSGSGTALNFIDVEFSESGTAIPYRSIDGYISIENNDIPNIAFDVADESVNPGQEVCVEVSVEDFVNIEAFDLDFVWDDMILSYNNVNIVSGVPGLDASDFTLMGDQLNVNWSNSGGGSGITLADGAILFEICFDAIGSAGSSTLVRVVGGTITNSDGVELNLLPGNGRITLNDILAINEIDVDSVSCFNGSDGAITLSVTGGSGSYDYTWDPPLSTGSALINLSAGTYDVTIDDGSGGMVTETIEVFEPEELLSDPQVTGVTPPMNNGEIDLNISGGTPPYSIDWCCGLQNDLEVQTGLEANTYSAVITDANGCVINTGEIDLGGGLFVREDARMEPRCHDSSDGSLTIAISGGTPNYQITWSDGNNVIGNTETISGLSAGTYFYTVTDSGSPQLSATGSFDLMGNPEIMITLDISPETNAGGDGSIITSVTGGVPTYIYSWFDYQTNGNSVLKDQFNLETGYYRLDVIDQAGCRVSRDSVFVGGPLVVFADSIFVDSISCPGECDGRITLFPSGGTGEYTYSFDGSGSTTSNTQGGFCAGDIIVIVEDVNNGDRTIVQVTLTDPDPLDVQYNSMGVSMGGDGGIVLDVSGGTEPYRYQWSNNATTKDIFGLDMGTYSVTITDANDCETVVTDIPVDVRTLMIQIERIVDIVCADDVNGSIEVGVTGGCMPYTYRWRRDGVVISNDEDLFNLSSGEYELEVIDQCNELLFSGPILIDAQSSLTITADIISDYNGFSVSGFGRTDGSVRVVIADGVEPYNIIWSNGSTNTFINDLSAGSYSVTVEDALGCTKTANVLLSQPSRIDVNFEIISVNDCATENNGVVRAIVAGGVPTYTYEWNNSGDTGPIASGLPSGFAVVTVTDMNNVQVIDSVFISSLTEFNISTIITADRGNGEGAITLLVNGGSGPYTYQWNDVNNSTTSSINGLLAGDYTVVVTDFNGCSELLVITVPLDGNAPECLESMEIFTPNGDGKNEFFVINCIENFVNDIEIFDRWGELIFEQENYDNLWDGRNMAGELLPQGAYFFVLNVINSDGQREAIKGHITLIR